MGRSSLTDAQRERMEAFCLGKPAGPGRTGGDNRLLVEAVLWIVRAGNAWRDLPPLSGKSAKTAKGHLPGNTASKRLRDWARADALKRLFDAGPDEPDRECAMAGATTVKVRRHGPGAKGGLQARPSAALAAAGRPRSWQ